MASGSISLKGSVSQASGRIDWSSTANQAGNYSTVVGKTYVVLKGWGIQGTGKGTWYENDVEKATFSPKVNVAYGGTGTTLVYTKSGIKVNHNASTGKATIKLGASMAFTFAGVNSISGSGTCTLDTIPRYAAASISVGGYGLNYADINYSSDVTIDYAWYSLNDGAYVGIKSGDHTSGSFRISNLSPNTSYTVKVQVRRKDSQLTSVSSAASFKTYNKATLTEVPNFTIGNNITIKFNNPGGASVVAGIYNEDASDVLVEYRNVTAPSYTFNFTAAEISRIYREIPNKTSGKFRCYLRTTQNGVQYYDYISKTFYVNESTNKPTFSGNLTYADVNSTITNLTGDSSKILLWRSKVKININNAAQGKNSATISKYTVSDGTTTKTIVPSGNAPYSTQIDWVGRNTIDVYAIDSRTLSTKNTLTMKTVDYVIPSISSSTNLKRVGGVGTSVNFVFSGKIWNKNFGKVQNAIQEFKYKKLPTTSSNWDSVSWITIPTDKYTMDSNGNITNVVDAILTDFTIGTAYNVKFYLSDKLDKKEFTVSVSSGEPTVAFNKTKKIMGVGKIPDRTLTPGSIDAKGQIVGQGFNFNSAFTNHWGTQGNANDFTRTGMYYLAESTNTPSTYVKTIVNGTKTMGDKNDVIQMCTSVSPDLPWTWVRAMQTSQGWGSWKAVTLDIGSYNGDLNSLRQPCRGYANTDALNKPGSSNGYFSVQRLNDDFILQEFVSYNNTYSSGFHSYTPTYMRQCVNGVWGGWFKTDNLRLGGVLDSVDLNSLYSKVTGIQTYITVPDQHTYTNFPPGAYQYGMLMVITQRSLAATGNNWMNAQIYIPDNSKAMYFRASTDSWRKVVSGNNLQAGKVDITPVANTHTYVTVNFPTAFSKEPRVMTQAWTGSPGAAVKGTGVYDITTTSCKIGIIRTDTTKTSVMWMAYEE